jgi:hypothetical protein
VVMVMMVMIVLGGAVRRGAGEGKERTLVVEAAERFILAASLGGGEAQSRSGKHLTFPFTFVCLLPAPCIRPSPCNAVSQCIFSPVSKISSERITDREGTHAADCPLRSNYIIDRCPSCS